MLIILCGISRPGVSPSLSAARTAPPGIFGITFFSPLQKERTERKLQKHLLHPRSVTTHAKPDWSTSVAFLAPHPSYASYGSSE